MKKQFYVSSFVINAKVLKVLKTDATIQPRLYTNLSELTKSSKVRRVALVLVRRRIYSCLVSHKVFVEVLLTTKHWRWKKQFVIEVINFVQQTMQQI